MLLSTVRGPVDSAAGDLELLLHVPPRGREEVPAPLPLHLALALLAVRVVRALVAEVLRDDRRGLEAVAQNDVRVPRPATLFPIWKRGNVPSSTVWTPQSV